jgi:hypothetical protein
MDESPKRVDASPTKGLFVEFLTKDLTLNQAITDLVDNSVDGARRLRGNDSLDGLYVHLSISRDSFHIRDNCGGIPIEVARHYAFRSGRPPDASATPHSVGQFGVGMKRALFKLGKWFSIESVAANSRFLLKVPVETWKTETGWEFKFSEWEDHKPQPTDALGTVIEVRELITSVSSSFALENFRTRLALEIQAAHQQSIAKGLTITLNRIALTSTKMHLLASNTIPTAHRTLDFGDGEHKVTVRIYAGISESKPTEAGWYVHCNGRLLLGADQTLVTGWGDQNEDRIPKYHNQYARFRGLVYFDCQDTSQLPWNTTKTGVDAESAIYQEVREQMMTLMRPVLDFLNELANERRTDSDGPLTYAVRTTSPILIKDEPEASRIFQFRALKPPIPSIPLQRIQYQRPEAQVIKVKESLRATNFKEVGEGTFDYYYRLECEE